MMTYFGKRMLLPTFRGRLVFSTILDLIIIIIILGPRLSYDNKANNLNYLNCCIRTHCLLIG